MRIEVNGETAEMLLNDMKYSSFIVDEMLGKHKIGALDYMWTLELLATSKI